MERIHPALDTDVIFKLPQSANYSDIHEYYTYMTSWIMHEQFAGRHYKPREQLKYFLEGLEASYAPAVARIRRQLDGWSTSNPTVPENLALEKLPNLIEKYLEEEPGAVIRRVGGKPATHREGASPSKSSGAPSDQRTYVDVQCPLCQTYGHYKYNCDKMAAWLHLKDGTKLVDDKLRAKLLANYAAVINKRREKRVSRLKGTVRQLYQDGNFEAGEELLMKVLPTLDNIDETNHSSDSEASTSS